jgi:hypothetical protein
MTTAMPRLQAEQHARFSMQSLLTCAGRLAYLGVDIRFFVQYPLSREKPGHHLAILLPNTFESNHVKWWSNTCRQSKRHLALAVTPPSQAFFCARLSGRKAQAHGKAFGFGHENSMYQIHRGRYSLHVTRQVTIVRVSIAPKQKIKCVHD